MTSIDEIQALNMVGIDLMEQYDFKEAASAFSYCLSQLSWCILSPSPLPSSNAFDATTDRSCTTDDQMNGQTSFSFYATDDDSNDESIDPRREFYVQAFLFECNNGAQPKPCPSFATSTQHISMNICILFNLGLCYHLEWERRRTENTALLASALDCYEQAYLLAKSNNGNGPTCFKPTDSTLKILMAVCTNATHCHCEMGNVDNVNVWNQALCRILVFCRESDDPRDSCGCNSSLDTLHNNSLGFFALNAFLNSIPRTVSRAA